MIGVAMYITIKSLWGRHNNKSLTARLIGHNWKTIAKRIKEIEEGKEYLAKKPYPRILDPYQEQIIKWLEGRGLTRSMRNEGRGESGEWLDHEKLGYNFRMDELSAALGCSQMERIEEILDKRVKVAGMYGEKLAEVEEVQVPYIAPYVSRMSWFVYVIRLDKDINRDSVIEYLNQEGVQCKPYFTPIHLQPFYRKMFGYKEGDFPITEDMTGRTIALPFFNNLKEEQIDYVVEKVKEGIKNSI